MSDNCRQHYNMATGKGLNPAPAKSAQPGYRNGGKVSKVGSRAPMRKGGRSTKC